MKIAFESVFALALFTSALVTGCGGAEAGDAGVDAAQDAGHDGGSDSGTDAYVPADAASDAGDDAPSFDAGDDAPPIDALMDGGTDMPSDSGVDAFVCPAPFLATDHMSTSLDILGTDGTGNYIFSSPETSGAETDGLTVAFAASQPIGVDEVLSFGSGFPYVIADYRYDSATMSSALGFGATSGRIRFTSACATGASGTISVATFSELDATQTSVVSGGCSFTASSIAFAIGGACP